MPAGPAAPTVDIETKKDSVDGWNLHIETTNFRFAPGRASGSHRMGEGHTPLYVNGRKIARLYEPAFHVGSLPKGMNKITVTLDGNDHRGLAVDGDAVSKTIEVDAHAMANWARDRGRFTGLPDRLPVALRRSANPAAIPCR